MASAAEVQRETTEKDAERRVSVARTEKGRWERLWPVIACGAGLFSDGYLNNVRFDPKSETKLPTRQLDPGPDAPLDE